MEKNIYSGVKVSVKLLDVAIFGGLSLLLCAIILLSAKGGFDVSFETDGGSLVKTQRLRYGESIVEPSCPTKEGAEFAGWFSDPTHTEKFDFENERVEGNMTVYAAWKDTAQ